MLEENLDKYGEDSEFNAGIATLRRIDEIKKHIDVDIAKQELEERYYHLKAFFMELFPVLSNAKKDDTTEREKQNKTRLAILAILEKYHNKEVTKETLMQFLDEWEMELRVLEQEHSLNMPMSKDARWALSTKRR